MLATSDNSSLVVVPRTTLMDEKVSININGLQSGQEITIESRALTSAGRLFRAHAFYVADHYGSVRLDRDASSGGDYTGVEPMGLFWALRLPTAAKESYSWFRITDVTVPILVTINIYENHIDEDELSEAIPNLTTTIERKFMNETISVTPVRSGRVRGTLFAPKRAGPHPGIIDLAGEGGALSMGRPALLATHGYAVLGLPYHGWDDLPPKVEILDVDYFEEAAEFLSKHSKVCEGGIGVVGDSLGGHISLLMAACIPSARCAVQINGPLFTPFPAKHKGREWEKVPTETLKVVFDRGAVSDRANLAIPNMLKHMPPFQDSKADMLFIISEDDGVIPWKTMLGYLLDLLKSGKKTNYKIVTYPGTGHKMEPPYSPVTKVTYFSKSDRRPIDFGGNTKDHAKAQEKFWTEILDFLENKFDHKSHL